MVRRRQGAAHPWVARRRHAEFHAPLGFEFEGRGAGPGPGQEQEEEEEEVEVRPPGSRRGSGGVGELRRHGPRGRRRRASDPAGRVRWCRRRRRPTSSAISGPLIRG